MQRIKIISLDISNIVVKNKKVILKWVKFFIITGIFCLLFINFPYDKFKSVLSNINEGLIVIGVLLSFVSAFFYTLFLWIVINEKKIPISLIRLYKINLGIKFYTLFSPTSLVGSGIRLYRLAENHRLEDALSAITFSRFVDTVVTLIDGLIWILISLYLEQINIWWILGIIIGLITLWFSFIKLSGPAIRLLDWIISTKKINPLIRRIFVFSRRYISSLVLFRTLKLKKVVLLIGLSLFYDLINTTIHFTFSSAIGINLGFTTLGWIRSVIAISSLIPLNTIGGLGVREISTYFLMTANGVSAEMAIAFSLFNYLRTSLVSLTGGIIEIVDTIRTKVRN